MINPNSDQDQICHNYIHSYSGTLLWEGLHISSYFSLLNADSAYLWPE